MIGKDLSNAPNILSAMTIVTRTVYKAPALQEVYDWTGESQGKEVKEKVNNLWCSTRRRESNFYLFFFFFWSIIGSSFILFFLQASLPATMVGRTSVTSIIRTYATLMLIHLPCRDWRKVGGSRGPEQISFPHHQRFQDDPRENRDRDVQEMIRENSSLISACLSFLRIVHY